MKPNHRIALVAIAVIGVAQPASADVISDWNEKAVAFAVSRNMGPPPAERIIAMTHVAMFDAVNSIERRYRPYLVQLPATATASKEAAAAAAAGTVLGGVDPQAAGGDEGRARSLSRRHSGQRRQGGGDQARRSGCRQNPGGARERRCHGRRTPTGRGRRRASMCRPRPPGRRSGRA